MNDSKLIQKFLEKSLTEEELGVFIDKFKHDTAFAKEVRDYSDMLISLQTAVKLDNSLINKSSHNKNSRKPWKRFFMPLALMSLCGLIYFAFKMDIQTKLVDSEEFNEINSAKHLLQNKIYNTSYSEAEYKDYSDETEFFEKFEDGNNENVRSFMNAATSKIFKLTKISNLDNRTVLKIKKIDINSDTAFLSKNSEVFNFEKEQIASNCDSYLLFKGPKGTKIRYKSYAFTPYDPTEVKFKIKEFFNLSDLLETDFRNSFSEKGYLAISRIIFLTAISKDGSKRLSVNTERCSNNIEVSVPIDSCQKHVTVFFDNKNNKRWNDTVPQKILTLNDTTYYIFQTDVMGGFNIAKIIPEKKKDYKIKTCTSFFGPKIINILSQNSYDKLIISGKKKKPRTYTLPFLDTDKKTNIIIKAVYKGKKYLVNCSIADLKKLDSDNTYKVTKGQIINGKELSD